MQNHYERERQVLANRLVREQADRALTASRRSAEVAADNARRNAQLAEQARQQQQIRQANERQRQVDQRAAQVEKEQRRQRDRNTRYPNAGPGSNFSSSLPAAPLGGGVTSQSRGTTRIYPPSRPIRKSSVAGALLAIVLIFAYCVAKGPKTSHAPTPGESGSSQVQPSAPADSTNKPAVTPAGDALK